jgi:hypothetical protein
VDPLEKFTADELAYFDEVREALRLAPTTGELRVVQDPSVQGANSDGSEAGNSGRPPYNGPERRGLGNQGAPPP